MAKKKKEKYVFNEEVECPYCNKMLRVKVEDKIITPAVKAEKERRIIVEKENQSKLA